MSGNQEPKYRYVPELLQKALEDGSLSQRGLRKFVLAQAKRADLDIKIAKSPSAWSGYFTGVFLIPLEPLRIISTHDLVYTSEDDFVDAWHRDRLWFQSLQIAKAEDNRIYGNIDEAASTLHIAIKVLENSPIDNSFRDRALAKAYTIYSFIGTHTASYYQLDNFLEDRVILAKKFAEKLDRNNTVDAYYFDHAQLLPHLVEYLKGQAQSARIEILALLNQLTDFKAKSLALRNLIVTTAICCCVTDEDTLDDLHQVLGLLDLHEKDPRVELDDKARMFEGRARAMLVISKKRLDDQFGLTQAIFYIGQARENISLLRAAHVPIPALIDVQVARTELEIYVEKEPTNVTKVRGFILQLAKSILPGWERYWQESRRLALATGIPDIVNYEYELQRANRTPHHQRDEENEKGDL